MFRAVAEYLVKSIVDVRDGVILNIGSGTPEYYRIQQPWAGAVMTVAHGMFVNIDKKPVGGRAGLNREEYIQADAVNLPFADRSIDLVLCVSMLEHVYGADIPRVLYEAWRVVKNGGMAVFEVPARYPEHPDPIDNGLRIYDLEGWEKLLGHDWVIMNFATFVNHGTSCTVVDALPIRGAVWVG